MSTPPPPGLQRALRSLRARGGAFALPELAQHLLALAAPLDGELARRLVAAALGRPAPSLPERIESRHLRPPGEVEWADTPLERAAFAVVDLETTGLSAERASIVEIGAVHVSRYRSGARFQTLVRPPGSMPRRIAALTGIDDAMLEDAPLPRRALGSFRRWLARRGSPPFVAHNASFDARFVRRGLEDARLRPYAAPVVCTRRLARRVVPALGRYGLDSLCAHFGVSNRARHRALGDAVATAEILVQLLALARARECVETVGDQLDIQERDIPPKRRR